MADYGLASDTATYHRIFELASQLRNPTIWDAALAIAADGGAPTIARLWSLIVLTDYASSDGVSLDGRRESVYANATYGCYPGGDGSSTGPTNGFPSEYSITAGTLARAIIGSGATVSLKHIAGCLLNVTEPMEEWDTSIPDTFVPSTHFSYVKQCGRKFVLRNSSNAWVSVVLSYVPISPHDPAVYRPWTMPPKPADLSYSQTTWTIPGIRTDANSVRVKHNGTSIMIEVASNTPC
jgi:hypothetical protein